MVAPTATDAKAAAVMSLGRVGSIKAEAASPEASKAKAGKRNDGLSMKEFPSLVGALSKSDSWPFLWLVKHMGSPALN